MQIPKTVVALTVLIPHSETLMALARKSRFVLRVPWKIGPNQILRAVLLAICDGTSHFRAIAKNLSALSGEEPSRQSVFEHLRH